MRCDEEKEQENDSGREPDEEPCAPCTRRATEFLGDHSGPLLGPPLVRFRYGYSSPKLREHKGRSTPGAERSFIKTFDPPEGSARGIRASHQPFGLPEGPSLETRATTPILAPLRSFGRIRPRQQAWNGSNLNSLWGVWRRGASKKNGSLLQKGVRAKSRLPMTLANMLKNGSCRYATCQACGFEIDTRCLRRPSP